MKKIILVAGARPNFMKVAPILRALEKCPKEFEPLLVHTGQHYDDNMSGSFFPSLGIREPDHYLGVRSGSHAVQTASVMIRFEEVCASENPDLVVVVGDVNSTIAAGLVAKKLGIELAHVEAGLRSQDRTMPEEINRIATDAISDLFFTTEEEANRNLEKEGQPPDKIHFVGHVMIDNLLHQLAAVKGGPPSEFSAALKDRLPKKYICMTMHRPSNVDDQETLSTLLNTAKKLAKEAPVILPCHPRTRERIEAFSHDLPSALPTGSETVNSGLFLLEPMDYNDFLYLWKDASLVITDSGGLQEETTALKIPCMTIRQNTERPITTTIGSNVVVGTDQEKIVALGIQALSGQWKPSQIPELWDGKASERIVDILRNH